MPKTINKPTGTDWSRVKREADSVNACWQCAVIKHAQRNLFEFMAPRQ